ncbi:MAG TPA: CaiB/BaiF CoA-transferase family protein, partial [Acidimicrobiales bacterium]|nr:CaiB/BaiF CoA-transferase family protein [Acidimicrobiales bacterium]
AGVTVLDLSTVGPAARASRWLADYGAQVVKVGAPEGLQIEPPFYAYSAHRGMERVGIDLKSDEGMASFLELVDSADVLIESFRPGVVDRLGIGYGSLQGRNRGLVYCSTSGYGQSGPRSQWAGHDLNYLGVGGFLDCTGRRADGQPPIPGATVADSAGGGMHAVIAILAALVRRASTGEGAHLDVSAADGVLALMALAVDEYLAVGTVPGPGHGILTGRYACYEVYGCADDRWLTVAAIEPRFWANLCQAVGLERWIDHQTDDDLQDEIRGELAAVFRTKTRDEWVAELGPADTCVAPVLSVPEVVDDEQYTARGAFVEASDAEHGAFRQVGYVLAGSGQ